MNTSLRSKQTQCLVQKSLRAISSTAKAESTLPKRGGQASLMSWNGNNQTASSITRKVSGASMGGGDDEFPMKLAHFIQRRNRHHAQKSQTQKTNHCLSFLRPKIKKSYNLILRFCGLQNPEIKCKFFLFGSQKSKTMETNIFF